MDTFEPPLWIAAYRPEKPVWQLNWDRDVFNRLVADEEISGQLNELWVRYCECADQVGPLLLEECLSMRSLWEESPKVPRAHRERVAKQVRRKALELADLMEHQAEALIAHNACLSRLTGLFAQYSDEKQELPERSTLEAAVDVLRCLGKDLGYRSKWEGDMELPDQPQHANAFRTATVERLCKFFWSHTGKPDYARVARFTNLIVNDPAVEIDANHVRKLDPGPP